MRWGVVVVAAATAACGGGDAPPPAPAEPAAEAVAPRLPVARVVDVEIGRLVDGLALTVFAEAPTPGWTRAALAPVGDGPGPDGWLTFDFLATPPEEPAPGPNRRLRADALIPAASLSGVQGLRIRTAGGPAEVVF